MSLHVELYPELDDEVYGHSLERIKLETPLPLERLLLQPVPWSRTGRLHPVSLIPVAKIVTLPFGKIL